jgi:hypothetical protein
MQLDIKSKRILRLVLPQSGFLIRTADMQPELDFFSNDQLATGN